VIGAVLILPLFPAEPKLGPVFQTVTHFIPPKFPILLIVPAILIDLFWSKTQSWKPWLMALVTGPIFVLSLVAVEWPFSSFLMTKAADNRFFGTTYFACADMTCCGSSSIPMQAWPWSADWVSRWSLPR
jgi:hypothetical protein